jgi:hypothetical protein
MPTVTNVGKESSADGSHRHVEGVCTTDGAPSHSQAGGRKHRRRQRLDNALAQRQHARHSADYLLPRGGLHGLAVHHDASGQPEGRQPGEPAGLLTGSTPARWGTTEYGGT